MKELTNEQYLKLVSRTNADCKPHPVMFELEEAKWIYKKWCEGYSTYDLAEALNCSRSTIKRTIKPLKQKKPLVVPEWVLERQKAKYAGELYKSREEQMNE